MLKIHFCLINKNVWIFKDQHQQYRQVVYDILKQVFWKNLPTSILFLQKHFFFRRLEFFRKIEHSGFILEHILDSAYVLKVFDFKFLVFGKELFIQFTANAFRKLPSIYVFSYFPFGFDGRMWGLIVSVPDHCLSFYFGRNQDD